MECVGMNVAADDVETEARNLAEELNVPLEIQERGVPI